MNPYGIAAPPAVSPALLALWTAEVARARAEYRLHPTTACHHMGKCRKGDGAAASQRYRDRKAAS